MRAIIKWTVAIRSLYSRFTSFCFNPVVYFRTKEKVTRFFLFVCLYVFLFLFLVFLFIYFFGGWMVNKTTNTFILKLISEAINYDSNVINKIINILCLLNLFSLYFHIEFFFKGRLIYSSKLPATIEPYSYETRRYKHNYLPLLERPSKNAKWSKPCCCRWSSFLKNKRFICVILYTNL